MKRIKNTVKNFLPCKVIFVESHGFPRFTWGTCPVCGRESSQYSSRKTCSLRCMTKISTKSYNYIQSLLSDAITEYQRNEYVPIEIVVDLSKVVLYKEQRESDIWRETIYSTH